MQNLLTFFHRTILCKKNQLIAIVKVMAGKKFELKQQRMKTVMLLK